MSIYVTTKPAGGLGAQMYMISHAVAQGIKHNVPTIIETDTWLSTYLSGPIRGQYVHWEDEIFRNINKVKTLPNDGRKLVVEQSFNNPNLNFILDGPIEFSGYFHGNKNLFGFDNEIRTLFSPTQEFIERAKIKYPEINNENTLSVHVRRGDFLWLTNSHPTPDISYINEAINQHGQYDTLFIFSNDIEWCLHNIRHPNMIIVNELIDYEAMWLMSLCKTNIIANSSFGWWGAFLNNNKNKKVYVTSTWFGPGGPYLDDQTMAPKEWIRVPTKIINGLTYAA